MVKLLIKTVLFSFIALIIFKVCEKYFIKENRFNYANYNYTKTSNDLKFDILFFGSSKSYCAYNPAIFKHNLGTNSYNLAGQGQVLEVTRFVIEEALKISNPKLIVVDVAYSMIAFNEKDSLTPKRKSYQLSVFDNYGLSINKIKYIQNIYDDGAVFYSMSPLIRNHDRWTDITLQNYKKPFLEGKSSVFLSNNGYLGTLQYIGQSGLKFSKQMDEGYEVLSEKNNKKITRKEIDVLKEIISIAKKNNVDILFVSTPSIKDYVRSLSFYVHLEQIFLELDVKYLNLFNELDEIGLKPHDFKEINHLNYNGGYKTSQYLSAYLKKTYNFIYNEEVSRNSLDNNITHHLLTNLKHTKKIIKEPYVFNNSIITDDIGYFKESKNEYVFIMKLNKESNNEELDNYVGYTRYFNGEITIENKHVKAFPLKTIKIKDDKFIFARVLIDEVNISKFDIFFLERKNMKEMSNVLSIKNIILDDNANK